MTELADQSAAHANTGTIEDDLRANALSVLNAITDERLGPTLQAVIAAATCDEEAAAALNAFYDRRIREWAKSIDLAIRRGELPEGTDGQEVIRAISAPLYYRLLVTKEPVDKEAAERSVARTLVAARNGAFIG